MCHNTNKQKYTFHNLFKTMNSVHAKSDLRDF